MRADLVQQHERLTVHREVASVVPPLNATVSTSLMLPAVIAAASRARSSVSSSDGPSSCAVSRRITRTPLG